MSSNNHAIKMIQKPCEECGKMFKFNAAYKRIPQYCAPYCKAIAKGKQKALAWTTRSPRKSDPRASEKFAKTAIGGRKMSKFERRYSTLPGCFR